MTNNQTSFTQLVNALIRDGLTQVQIAKLAGCAQTTISELQTGKTLDPRSSVGMALSALATKRGIEVDSPFYVKRKKIAKLLTTE